MKRYALVDCMGIRYEVIRSATREEAERSAREMFPEINTTCECCGRRAMKLVRLRRRPREGNTDRK